MNELELNSENNQYQKTGVEEFFNIYRETLIKEFNGKEVTLLVIGGSGDVLSEVIIGKSGLKFSKVIGVDVNEEAVKLSNEKYGSDLISFQAMDAGKEIPETFKDWKFDLITSFYCLTWVNDFNIAFQNIQKLLKPNGIFCCMFLQLKQEKMPEMGFKESFVMKVLGIENLPSFRIIENPSETMKNYLIDNGMELIEIIDNENYKLTFESLEAVKNYSESLIPNLQLLPDSQKPKIFEKMFSMFGLVPKNNKFVLDARNVSFVARKSADF